MKNSLVPLAFAAVMLYAGTAAGAQEKKSAINRKNAEGIAELITRPVREIVRPAALKAGQDLSDAMQSSNASAWALWDLLSGLSKQLKTGKKPEPDVNLVGTYIRLRMRCNTGDLCLKPGAPCKAYPGSGEFAKAVQIAQKDIKTYATGLYGQSPLMRQHRMRIENFMETARKRAIFPLQMTRAKNVQPTPATQEETKYRQISLTKKQSSQFTLPPWP